MTMLRHVFTLAAVLCALPVWAEQSKPAAPATMSINLFEAKATLAMPPWVKGADVVGQSEIFNQRGKGGGGRKAFIQEFIPKGQKFESWREIYAILAETPYRKGVKSYRKIVDAPFKKACTNFDTLTLLDKPEAHVYLIFCPSYKATPTVGEMAVMAIWKYENTIMRFYYEVRGKAFPKFTKDIDIRLLPMTQKNMNYAVKYLSGIRLEAK